MHHDNAAIAAKVNIDFHGVGVLLPAQPHGGEGIFGRIERGATMCDDLRHFEV